MAEVAGFEPTNARVKVWCVSRFAIPQCLAIHVVNNDAHQMSEAGSHWSAAVVIGLWPLLEAVFGGAGSAMLAVGFRDLKPLDRIRLQVPAGPEERRRSIFLLPQTASRGILPK